MKRETEAAKSWFGGKKEEAKLAVVGVLVQKCWASEAELTGVAGMQAKDGAMHLSCCTACRATTRTPSTR